jgi:hypothetical protein
MLYGFLRHAVPLTSQEGDDDKFEVFHISVMCIKSLLGRQGKHLLLRTHLSDADIPHILQRVNEVHYMTSLQEIMETPQWHAFAQA